MHTPPASTTMERTPPVKRVPPATIKERGGGRDVLERPYTVGGGGVTSPDPPLPPSPWTFEADSQNVASAPLAPRGFKLQKFRPTFVGDHRGP